MPARPLPWQEFLDSLEVEDRESIELTGTMLYGARGQTLFRQGEPGDAMHVILLGRVELQFEGVGAGKTLGPGDILGELALLLPNHRRTASALVVEDATLLTFDQAAFERLAERHPRALAALLRSTCGYLLDSERRLIDDLRRKNSELERTLDYLRRTREELDSQELLAQTDELTGLYNRRCFNIQIENFMERARATSSQLALILVDLDGLKPINDTFGHVSGDIVLKHVASTIRSSVRRADLPCRVGGDEFAILMEAGGARQAMERAERIRGQIGSTRAVVARDGKTCELPITVSIGGTMFNTDDTSQLMLQRADEGLYLAKNSGRDRVAWDGQLLGPSGAVD